MDIGCWRLAGDIRPQITPRRVHPVDQLQFPRAVPFLDSFLPLDCRFHRFVHFVPDQSRDVVAIAEAIYQMLPVLRGTRNQVAGDSGISSSIAIICQQADTWLSVHRSSLNNNVLGFPPSRE
jgi:hypothetical protein